MAKIKRKFTAEERLSILKEGERQGQTETLSCIIYFPIGDNLIGRISISTSLKYLEL